MHDGRWGEEGGAFFDVILMRQKMCNRWIIDAMAKDVGTSVERDAILMHQRKGCGVMGQHTGDAMVIHREGEYEGQEVRKEMRY